MVMMKGQHSIKSFYKPAVAGFSLVVISILVVISAPLGSRFRLWDYDFAVMLLRIGAYGFILAGFLCLFSLIITRPGKTRRGFALSLIGLLTIFPTLLFLNSWQNAKMNLPPIQDITTDTENPPEFWTAPNSRDYGGPSVAAYQMQAYPDVKPLILDVPVDKAYELALEVIRIKNWRLWAANREEKHIEATETTFWFGFSDDVVVHITKADTAGSRVDMRSVSRFGGGGDGGTNANRIRSFFRELKKRA